MRMATVSAGLVRATAVIAASLTLPACYTFRAIDPLVVSPGEQVQLLISGSSATGVTRATLMGETFVEGNLVGISDDSISVSVWIGEAYRGTPFESVHQVYTVPRVDLVRLESRQLSKPRTALTILGILGGIYLFIDRMGFLEDPNPDSNGGIPFPPDPPFTVRY